MAAESLPISILPASECWNLLSGAALGRLVTCVDGEPGIFPVNFVVQQRTVLFRTAEGTKLFSALASENVLFEVDEHGFTEGWSVIVKGRARTLHTDDDIEAAGQAHLLPWIATEKQHFVRIRPVNITGRRFVFGPEPNS